MNGKDKKLPMANHFNLTGSSIPGCNTSIKVKSNKMNSENFSPIMPIIISEILFRFIKPLLRCFKESN